MQKLHIPQDSPFFQIQYHVILWQFNMGCFQLLLFIGLVTFWAHLTPPSYSIYNVQDQCETSVAMNSMVVLRTLCLEYNYFLTFARHCLFHLPIWLLAFSWMGKLANNKAASIPHGILFLLHKYRVKYEHEHEYNSFLSPHQL